MSRFRLGLVLAALAVVVLLISAPARLLALVVPSQQLVLQGYEGTLWRGSAARCLIKVGHGYVHLGRIDWQLSASSLLTLSPRLTLASEWGRQQFSGEITLHNSTTVDIKNAEGRAQAQLLRQFMPLLIGGEFTGQVQQLRVKDGQPYAGTGRLVWENASWLAYGGARTLGSYALDFEQSEGQPLIGEVVTIAGPLNVAGNLRLEGRNYTVDVLLEQSDALDEQLQQALSLVAQPVASGYRVELQGQF
ncbi:MAG: type II secretion system protein N [Halioglobus sp.]